MIIGNPKSTVIELIDKKSKSRVIRMVFSIIEDAYAAIGGLKSQGMGTPEEMVINSNSIILSKIKNKIAYAIITKSVTTNDHNIKKIVALATNGTSGAKKELGKDIGKILEEMCVEVSGPAERFIRRSIGDKEFSSISIPAEEVSEILNKNTIPTDENDFRYQRTLSDGTICIKTLIGNVESDTNSIS